VTAEGEPEDSLGDEGALPIDLMARVVGSYVWVEGRLFEILGHFAATDPAPVAVLYFDATAGGCAGRAAAMGGLLPLIPGAGPDAVVVAPGDEAAGALDDLAGRPGTLSRLAGVVRVVLPRMVAGYQAHLARTVAVADANLARVLRTAVHEHLDALSQGEALLQRLGADDPAGLEEATAGLASLDDALARVGTGFVPWPIDTGGVA